MPTSYQDRAFKKWIKDAFGTSFSAKDAPTWAVMEYIGEIWAGFERGDVDEDRFKKRLGVKPSPFLKKAKKDYTKHKALEKDREWAEQEMARHIEIPQPGKQSNWSRKIRTQRS